MTKAPRVFMSYSHDNDTHKNWVLNLATRLNANGVDLVFDQWDLRIGNDLPRFMENGLADADRVIMICTENYVQKAKEGKGGVGYEKMIMTADLLKDTDSNKIFPLIRGNKSANKTPIFLGSKVYIDFDEDNQFEKMYEDLIREIHGEHVKPRPALGENPFLSKTTTAPPIKFVPGPEKYTSAASSGSIRFDYSNNNGTFVIGCGKHAFETKWTKASDISIHAYNDSPTIKGIALSLDVKEIKEIKDAASYDFSSRVRTVREGEILVAQNKNGYYAAVKVTDVKDRTRSDGVDELSFEYLILTNKSSNFTSS